MYICLDGGKRLVRRNNSFYAETQFPTSPRPSWVKCCQLDKMRPVKRTVTKKNMVELIVCFRLQKE